MEIGGKQERAGGGETLGQSFVDCVGGGLVDGNDGVRRIDAAVEAGDGAVLGGEQLGGGAGVGAGGDHEAAGGVGRHTRRRGCSAAGRGNRDRQRRAGGELIARTVERFGLAGPVLGDPQPGVGAERDPPRVDQIRVGRPGCAGDVGDEVGLGEGGGQEAANLQRLHDRTANLKPLS